MVDTTKKVKKVAVELVTIIQQILHNGNKEEMENLLDRAYLKILLSDGIGKQTFVNICNSLLSVSEPKHIITLDKKNKFHITLED